MFASRATAEALVAGVPAAARAARSAALAGFGDCLFAVRQGRWNPDPALRSEITRLAPGLACRFGSSPVPGQPLLSGEELVDCANARQTLADRALPPVMPDEAAARRVLAAAAKRIVAATTKPGDGIVSRLFNRRISQFISLWLLRLPGARPWHASLGTAALAIIMVAAFLTGSDPGLIVGALLFQAASIFDGVDGEIARATFRASPTGARLDSLIDAGTNLGAVGGVAANLAMQGESAAARAGMFGIALLAVGLFLVGRRGTSAEGGLHFDAVKEQFMAQKSSVMTWLAWLTMRDFYAAFGATLVVLGFAVQAMFLLAAIAAAWLAVVLLTTRSTAVLQ